MHCYSEYKVNWGSVNHLKAILFLSKKALENNENHYFHLITGQDFPVKAKHFFINELDTNKDYLEYFELPAKCWSGNGGIDRLEYYHPYETFDCKTRTGGIMIRTLLMIQKLFKQKRKYTNPLKLFGGSTYWSLRRGSLQYVLDFTNMNNFLLKRMNYTFCSEEIYFQTILLNQKTITNITNCNLRYIDWCSGRGGYPAFLDKTDLIKIRSSNAIFARKFHEINSEELKKEIINNLV